MTHTNPVPDPTARHMARYDTDPEALAWARAKVQHQLDRLAAFEEQAAETGKGDVAAGLSLARRSTGELLLGGEGCVVGAFDERRPVMFAEAAAGEVVTEIVGPTRGVLNEVYAERVRQDNKWGEQNHPDGTGQYPETIDADVARMACQNAAEGGYLDWLHILREEVAEAFAETDPVKLRTELLQVAAVAVCWIEALDRRTQSGAADVAFLNAEFPDEPQDPTGPETPAGDTLPEWLCQRFGGRAPALYPRSFWEHEADAVRRAVARGGFKAQVGAEQ